MIDPQTNVEASVFSFLQNYIGLLFFLLINGHHWFLLAVNDSFRLLAGRGIQYSWHPCWAPGSWTFGADSGHRFADCRPGHRGYRDHGCCLGSHRAGRSADPYPYRRHAAQDPGRLWLPELFLLFSSALPGGHLLHAVQNSVFPCACNELGVFMAGGSDNKSEKPTQKKAQKSAGKRPGCAQQGSFFRRACFSAVLCWCISARRFCRRCEYRNAASSCASRSLRKLPFLSFGHRSMESACGLPLSCSRCLLAALVFSVAANVMQGGLVFSTEVSGLSFRKAEPEKWVEADLFQKRPGRTRSKACSCLVDRCPSSAIRSFQTHLPLYPGWS